VALARASLERPRTPEGDPRADMALARSLGPSAPVRRGPMFEYLAARTAFFDDATLEVLKSGCRQVIVVGAGYDGRALRFNTPDVRFIEIDHPATQANKRARLQRLDLSADHISFAAADFNRDDVGAALAQAGHDAHSDSFFLCEGVLLYLEEPVIVRLLRALRTRSTATSILAVNIPVGTPASYASRWRRLALELMLSMGGEPPRTRLTSEGAFDLLARGGWSPLTVSDPSAFNPRARPGYVLLVRAEPRSENASEPAGTPL
jgi:methyltransferase (TIGR00027 family)